MLQYGVGTAPVGALEPWAAFLHAGLAHLPFLRGITADAVLVMTVFAFALGVLNTTLSILSFAQSAGEHPKDILSYASHFLFKVVYVPASILEVGTTIGIALLARQLMTWACSVLPVPPSGDSRPASAAGSNANLNANDATGGPEDSDTLSGVKYDGYRQAIAASSRQKNYVGEKRMKTIDQQSEIALEHIRLGILKVADIGKTGAQARGRVKHTVHTHATAATAAAAAKRGRGRGKSKDTANKQQHEDGGGGDGTDSRSIPRILEEEEGMSDGSGGGRRKSAFNRLASAPAAVGGGSRSTTTLTTSATTIPSRGNDEGVQEEQEEEEHEVEVESGVNINNNDQEHKHEEDIDMHALNHTQGYSGPELPSSIRAHAVVESLYENERLQPFRGWGHDWPGHFLPTDKVLHWSRIDHVTGDDLVYSQTLREAVPRLPPGWRWVESEWHLDLTGVFSDATDTHGWSYGLDFPWVIPPFQPGTGRKKMADFVRRRRWLRTRVPISATATTTTTTVQGVASSSGGGGTSSSSSSSSSKGSVTQ